MASELSVQKVKAAIRKIAWSRSPGKRRSEEFVLYTYRNTLAPQLTAGRGHGLSRPVQDRADSREIVLPPNKDPEQDADDEEEPGVEVQIDVLAQVGHQLIGAVVVRLQAFPGLVRERDGDQRNQGRPWENADDDPHDDDQVRDRGSDRVPADHGGGLYADHQRALPRLGIGKPVRDLVRIQDQHDQNGDRNR